MEDDDISMDDITEISVLKEYSLSYSSKARSQTGDKEISETKDEIICLTPENNIQVMATETNIDYNIAIQSPNVESETSLLSRVKSLTYESSTHSKELNDTVSLIERRTFTKDYLEHREKSIDIVINNIISSKVSHPDDSSLQILGNTNNTRNGIECLSNNGSSPLLISLPRRLKQYPPDPVARSTHNKSASEGSSNFNTSTDMTENLESAKCSMCQMPFAHFSSPLQHKRFHARCEKLQEEIGVKSPEKDQVNLERMKQFNFDTSSEHHQDTHLKNEYLESDRRLEEWDGALSDHITKKQIQSNHLKQKPFEQQDATVNLIGCRICSKQLLGKEEGSICDTCYKFFRYPLILQSK